MFQSFIIEALLFAVKLLIGMPIVCFGAVVIISSYFTQREQYAYKIGFAVKNESQDKHAS